MNPKYQAIVRELAERTVTVTSAHLSRMLDGLEDTLLDFADKAESNEGRQGFFDAIRELSTTRGDIEKTFREGVDRGFSVLLGWTRGQDTEDTPSELSLVDKEDFEDRLAIESIANRAVKQFHGELYALKQRLAVINRGIKIRSQALPGGPFQLTQSFAKGVQRLPLEKRVMLILYVIFHRQVLKQLEELYAELNERLAAVGVLPYLKPEVKNPDQPGSTRPRPAAAPAMQAAQAPAGQTRGGAAGPPPTSAAADPGGPASDVVLRDVLDLLGRLRGPETGGAAGPTGPPASAPDLASTITRAAESRTLPPPAAELRNAKVENPEINPALMAEITEALTQQREMIVQLAGSDRVRAVDADTIDLVGMLFEYMLGTDELPNAVKALLSHLHTPYLKLAILDQSFLDQRDHPARELLDLMIESGSTLVVETDLRRGIYPELRDLVNRILADFTDDVGLFADLLADLRHSVAERRQKADALEARAREAEKGRQQLRLAQKRARAELQALVRDRSLPGPVMQFIEGFLTEKLTLLLLRSTKAERTQQWKRTTELGRALIRAASPPPSGSPDTVRAGLAGLEKVIRDERAMLGSHYNRQIEELLGWLAAARQGAAPKAPLVRAARAETTETPRSAPPASPAEAAAAERLGDVEFGTWFELQPDGEQKPRRVRLSWYNPTTTRYMFVNQDGVTAAVKDANALVREMAEGRARIVELPRRPFMDRALQTIRRAVERSLGVSLSGQTEKEPT